MSEPASPRPWRAPLAVRASAGLHGTAAALLLAHPSWWPGLLAAVAGNHAALGAAGMLPGSTLLGPALRRCRLPGRAVALTFDDGPDPDVTPAVLDILAAHGATASFFCIAERARRHPALVRRIHAAGHRVENHSLTHPPYFAALAGRTLWREVSGAQAALADLTGAAPGWFRAPMGLRSPLLDPALHRAGLHLAAWSRRGYDTRDADPAAVLGRLARRAAPGEVLLLHDGHAARRPGGRAVVLDVLPRLLRRLNAAGLATAALPAPETATGSLR